MGLGSYRYGFIPNGKISGMMNVNEKKFEASNEKQVHAIAAAASPARGLILNLGHGCLPHTPVEGVRAFTAAAKSLGGGAR